MHGGGDDTSAFGHDWLLALFNESPVAVSFARDGVILDANQAYARLFGYDDAAELRGKSILEQIATPHRDEVSATVTHRARGERAPERYQTVGLKKDGAEFPFEVTTTRVVLQDGPLSIAFITDVSDREDAVSALRASEERFRTLSAAALEGVFVHSGGKIVLANEAGASMYGFDPASMVGASLMDLTAPESRETVAGHIQRGEGEPYEGVAQRRDGTRFPAEVRGRTLSHQGRPTRVTIIRDITDQKRIELEQRALAERMRQAQKLESLGALAGGVAHDFNNILTVIANGVTLAKQETGSARAAHLDTIALAAERAADLCRQMLAYAGKAPIAREPVDVSAVVAEMASMLEASIATKATLVRDLTPTLPSLLGDATQIRQIVMNLVLNASEAIRGPVAAIRVSTGTGTYDAEALARSAAGGAPRAGAYVWLEVKDDGIGMDAATVAHMFDPFFTTKFVGRGLGMAAVLGIVRGHDGAIEVESHPGYGTRVRVLFPASSAEPPATVAPTVEPGRGEGLVLVVDDEKNVRMTTELLLRRLGFEVIAARDGAEAIATFRAESSRVDAVLLDLTMPRMDGLATLKELRRIDPSVPVVLTSGYGSTRLGDSKDGTERPDAILAKPYGMDRLLETLRGVMQRRDK